jgi:hypothetical protein
MSSSMDLCFRTPRPGLRLMSLSLRTCFHLDEPASSDCTRKYDKCYLSFEPASSEFFADIFDILKHGFRIFFKKRAMWNPSFKNPAACRCRRL